MTAPDKAFLAAVNDGPNKRGYVTYLPGPFDYSLLAADLADEARAAAERITSSQRDHLIEVGRELLRIKQRIAHGQSEDWCDRALFMTPRSARNYMQVARHFGDKPEIVSVLPAASVYRLAYAPPAVRQQIVTRFEAGEYVDRNEVDEAIRRPKFEAAEGKRVAVVQKKKKDQAERRRRSCDLREQNSREKWEAEEERERQERRRAASELVAVLSAHFDLDAITTLNKLWATAHYEAVREAATSAVIDPSPEDTCKTELANAWDSAGPEARTEFLSRIGGAMQSGGGAV